MLDRCATLAHDRVSSNSTGGCVTPLTYSTDGGGSAFRHSIASGKEAARWPGSETLATAPIETKIPAGSHPEPKSGGVILRNFSMGLGALCLALLTLLSGAAFGGAHGTPTNPDLPPRQIIDL